MSCALYSENSNGENKQAYGILLFNHYKHIISTTNMFMATKLGRVVTYTEGLSTQLCGSQVWILFIPLEQLRMFSSNFDTLIKVLIETF